MNTQEFLTQVSATPEEREVLEIIASSRPLKKLQGRYPKPLDLLRSPYLDNPYVFNALLQDFSRDHYSFRPYIKALKGLYPKDPKGLSLLSFMMALSIEMEEPLVQEKVLYLFRHSFPENSPESFGLYSYLLYFSFSLEAYPVLEKYRPYTTRIREAVPLEHFPEQFSLLQFLFQGNPLQIGKGDSGGLSTFLLQLGKALTRSMEISEVYTLSLIDVSKDHSSFPLVQKIEDEHIAITLPFHVGEDRGFIKSHSFLKAMVSVVLNKLQLNPNIYHVRYLNDASLSMAKLGKERKRPVVLTLTPDPHRSMIHEKTHRVVPHNYEEGMEKIHKVQVGKKMLASTGGVLGIGGTKAKKRLLQYFPELETMAKNKPFQMISEGIDIHLPSKESINIEKVLTSKYHRYAIDPKNLGKPYIVNVGRLHPLKGQQKLLEAFYRSGAYEKYNLLIIGGNVQRPNEGERNFLNFEKDFLKSHRELQGSYVHIPGVPNRMVRLIERKINKLENAELPHIYFCSSEKEEFGIAILEAMVEGFIAVGPKAGGVSTYIQHGKNGFLGEMGNVWDMEKSLRETMDFFAAHPKKIQGLKENSIKTIQEDYSMEAISLKFAKFYREVLNYDKC
ncbi:glycosyltransferase family 4 protein [Isachenkonia alkalipeptolytica]|nr:glycosyltransferase family 4 protein [Isachenkonia alkalipeptolytica]